MSSTRVGGGLKTWFRRLSRWPQMVSESSRASPDARLRWDGKVGVAVLACEGSWVYWEARRSSDSSYVRFWGSAISCSLPSSTCSFRRRKVPANEGFRPCRTLSLRRGR